MRLAFLSQSVALAGNMRAKLHAFTKANHLPAAATKINHLFRRPHDAMLLAHAWPPGHYGQSPVISLRIRLILEAFYNSQHQSSAATLF